MTLQKSIWLVGLLVCVGCSSSSSSSSSGSGSSSSSGSSGTSGGSALERLCGDYGDTLCVTLTRCQIASEPADCSQTLAQACEARVSAAVAAGRQKVTDAADYERFCTPTAAAQVACTDQTAFAVAFVCGLEVTSANVPLAGACHTDLDCDPLPDAGSVSCVSPPSTCGGVCKHGAALGEPCGFVGVSVSYLGCDQGYCPEGELLPDGGTSTPTCQSYGAAGAACGDGNHVGVRCDPSLYCGFDTAAGGSTCQALLGAGATCNGDGCGAGLFCGNPDAGFSDETCLTTVATGQPCNAQLYGQCGPAAGCSQVSHRCAADQARPGEPCDAQGTRCTQDSGATGLCQGQTADQLGTCVAVDAGHVPALGDPCTGPADDEASCGSDAFFSSSFYRCVAGHCAALPVAGQPCSALGHCQLGSFCNAQGQCTADLAAGAACAVADHSCAQGFCDPVRHVCTARLAPGAACDPTQPECSNDTRDCKSFPDGGMACLDARCSSTDGGATVCQTPCE